MIEAKFLDRLEDGVLAIHDFWDHAPDYVRKRRLREKQREEKGDMLTGHCPVNDRSLSGHCPPNGRTPAPAPAPAPAPNKHIMDASASDGCSDGNGKPKQKKFAKPTLDEVRAYIAEKSYHFDAEEFISFYESKGWKIGVNQMKDWKAACRTWESRWKKDNPEASGRDPVAESWLSND